MKGDKSVWPPYSLLAWDVLKNKNVVWAELPVMIETGKKKIRKTYLNMNNYRNWHHHLSSDIKQAFEPIRPPDSFVAERIRIEYIYYRADNRRVDLMNIISVVDKFFLDWLVKNKYIPDDTIYNVEYGAIRPIVLTELSESKIIAIIQPLE